MKNRDLQFIIKDMAARLDSRVPDDVLARPGMLSEVEAYMAVDATLASLHKEFLEARRNRVRALEQQGENSAMADIARDLEESAQSAIETRMIELRATIAKRMMAEQMQAQAQMQEIDECREASGQEFARRQAGYNAESAVMAQRKRAGEDSFFTLLLLWWMMRQTVWQTQLKLSLVSSFSMAQDRDYAARAA